MIKKKKRTDPKCIIALSTRQRRNSNKMEKVYIDEAFFSISGMDNNYSRAMNKAMHQYRRKNGTTTENEINYFINHEQ